MLSRQSQLSRALAIVAVVACAGCGAPATKWTKPGASEQQLAQDLQSCNQTAGQWGAASYFDPRRGQIISGSQDASQTQAACMMGRGWVLTP